MLPSGIRKITVQFLILAVIASSAVLAFTKFGDILSPSGAKTPAQSSTSPIGQNAFAATAASAGGLLKDSDIAGHTNLTEVLASNIALQVLKSNPDGPTADSKGQMGFDVPKNIDSILAQSMSGAAPSMDAIFPKIAANSIKTQKDYTSSDILHYLNALVPLIQAQGDNTYLAALEGTASSSPTAVSAVDSSIAQLLDSLLVAPVPQPFVKFHVSLLNMLDTQDKLVTLTASDPMRALLLMDQAQALLARENSVLAQNAADIESSLPSIKAGMKTADGDPSLNAKLAELFDFRVKTAHAQAAGGLLGGLGSGLLGCAQTLWPLIGSLIDHVASWFGFYPDLEHKGAGAEEAAADAVVMTAEQTLAGVNAAKSVPISNTVSDKFDLKATLAVKEATNKDQRTNSGTQMTTGQNYCQQLLEWLKKVGTQLLINDLVNRIQKAVIAWATGGDPLKAAADYGANGGPKFVTNWKQFALTAFNDAVGAVIQEIEPKLCSPLAPYLKIVLKPVPSGPVVYPTCTLDSVLSNLNTTYDQFTNNFLSGGMVTYAQVLQPQNNLWGSYVMASDAATAAGAAAEEAAVNQASAGSGYMGTKACVSTHVVTGQKSMFVGDPKTVSINSCDASGFCSNIVVCDSLDDWKITTSGADIAHVVGVSLTSTIERIINAEDLTQLFSFAVSSVLSKLIGSRSSAESGNVGGDPGILYGNLSSNTPAAGDALCSNFSPDTPEYAACTRNVDDTSVYCQQYPEGSDDYNSCVSTYQGILNGTTTAAQAATQPQDPIGPPPDAIYATAIASTSKSGVFFTVPTATSTGATRMDITLGLEPNKNYHSLSADFDMHVSDFAGGAFTGTIVDLNRPNPSIDPTKRGYMASWITILNGNTRTVIDTLDNRFQAKATDWTADTNYHIHLVYDTAAATVTMSIKNTDSNTDLATVSSPVSNTDLRDIGGGITMGFGLEVPVDSGVYVPPYGWTFSNLQVTATP